MFKRSDSDGGFEFFEGVVRVSNGFIKEVFDDGV